MEHVLLKAAVSTVTEEGVFEAVISSQSVDREKDIVEPAAMVDALQKWNRPIPLAWNHSRDAQGIFGSIEPKTIRNVDGEVIAQGTVDLDSEMGREAWRSFKNRSVGFSFGYLILQSEKRKGGGLHITELDVFEITATPTPVNNDTRVLNTKAIEEDADKIVFPDGVWTKAVWTTAYINSLPDSAFLYVEPGEKDSEGKTTPRSKRHFPYKDADGSIDLPHLRNALARIPQSNLSQDLKDRLTRKAERILDQAKSLAIEDAGDEGPGRGESQAQDPQRKEARELALEVASGGVPPQPPKSTDEPRQKTVEPEIPLDELRRECRELMLEVLTGEIPT